MPAPPLYPQRIQGQLGPHDWRRVLLAHRQGWQQERQIAAVGHGRPGEIPVRVWQRLPDRKCSFADLLPLAPRTDPLLAATIEEPAHVC